MVHNGSILSDGVHLDPQESTYSRGHSQYGRKSAGRQDNSEGSLTDFLRWHPSKELPIQGVHIKSRRRGPSLRFRVHDSVASLGPNVAERNLGRNRIAWTEPGHMPGHIGQNRLRTRASQAGCTRVRREPGRPRSGAGSEHSVGCGFESHGAHSVSAGQRAVIGASIGLAPRIGT